MSEPMHRDLPGFGPRLRRLRRARSMKQAALAETLDTSQATVSRWEAGVQLPDGTTRRRALELLTRDVCDDAVLRRLVEHSSDCLHLVDEANHVCLAYSPSRARQWRQSQRALLGQSLWPYATAEIQAAEAALDGSDWWESQTPNPRLFHTSRRVYDALTVVEGGLLWERLYLSDGTPVRLCSQAPSPHK